MSTETHGTDSHRVRVNKMDLLERVADSLAHEIKNPLHSMVINLEVLKRRVARSGAAEADDMMRSVRVLGDELDRIHRHIELLLRLARPIRRSEPVPAGEMVEDLLELVRVEGSQRGVAVRYEAAPTAADARVFRSPMQQAVLALVLGALDEMEQGDAIRLRLEPDEANVLLALEREPATGGEDGGLPEDGFDALETRLASARVLAEIAGAHLRIPSSEASGHPRAAADESRITLSIPTVSG